MKQSQIQIIGKYAVFIIVMLFLFVPLSQKIPYFRIVFKPLDGAYQRENDISFSRDGWFSSEYQVQKEKFIKESFGLHHFYIRLSCQLNFSIFKKANVSYMVVGKENYLYESAYIDAYYGRDFIGLKKANEYISKLKKIQDTLEKQNKLIFTVFAPGKACFYPEFIPENYKSEKTLTNYEALKNAAVSKNVNHIDFYKYFQDLKPTSKYPLYPQFGIHWSDYGAIMAIDSMVHYVEHKTGVNLPDFQIKGIEVVDTLRNTDDDAIKSLNLFKNPKTFNMAYPNWKVHYDTTQHKKLKLLVISDSFWWYIYSTAIPDEIFKPVKFWYYNNEIYPESFDSPLHVSEVNYADRIRQADVIIIMHSESTLQNFGDGFVDLCYNTFYRRNIRKENIQVMKEKIRTTPEWFKQIQNKAQERGIEIDSMLTLDAIYMLKQPRP